MAFASLSIQLLAPGIASDQMVNSSYLHNARSTMNSLSAFLAALQVQFEAIIQTIPIGRYLVRQGDTLQNISMQYYQTSENWELLFTHNNLTTTVLTQGQLIEIPKL
jgi:nucleoid-associated protein YgaU